MHGDSQELVKILETRDQTLITAARSFFDGAGIRYAMNNEFIEGIWPTGPDDGTQLWVKPEDAEVALTILSDLMEQSASDAGSSEALEAEEAVEDQPAAMEELSYEAPQPEQPFSIRLLVVAAALLIPIILAILYSLRN